MELVTALSRAVETPPPRLMLATAGLAWFWVTQSTPMMTPALEPDPLQSTTRTAWRVTPSATPYVLPPTVPAPWVPCPLQSSWAPPSTASQPLPTPPCHCPRV